MFLVGLAMAHVFVPAQAAAFARISQADTARGSTIFNALRQLGGAAGVAILSSVLAGVGVSATPGGGSLTAFHVAFLTAAGLIALAIFGAVTIHDADADSTRTGPRTKKPAAPAEQPA